jgi:hypothetical protein
MIGSPEQRNLHHIAMAAVLENLPEISPEVTL